MVGMAVWRETGWGLEDREEEDQESSMAVPLTPTQQPSLESGTQP